MSRKELPRPGLVAAALAGRITNWEGARALHLTVRQFQRLKQRHRTAGAPALRYEGQGRPSHRRLPAAVTARVQALLRDRDRHWSLDEELAGTQVSTHLGRVLQDLGIGYVQASRRPRSVTAPPFRCAR